MDDENGKQLNKCNITYCINRNYCYLLILRQPMAYWTENGDRRGLEAMRQTQCTNVLSRTVLAKKKWSLETNSRPVRSAPMPYDTTQYAVIDADYTASVGVLGFVVRRRRRLLLSRITTSAGQPNIYNYIVYLWLYLNVHTVQLSVVIILLKGTYRVISNSCSTSTRLRNAHW